ncbi:helix-turn-helix domain-containing protein [Amycolatopsis sp. lyj-346]|uniref:helix-turn-helix domain-containing protein n=1 Tax=Amycolatopsis sp. lyj-346 TaxID=2789289 RepID=UPI00397B803D
MEIRKHDHGNGVDHIPVTLGDYIRHGREDMGMSTRKLSQQLGMHPSYISRVEAGAFQHPSPEKLQRIATCLNLEYASLCALAGYGEPGGLPNYPAYLRLKFDMSDEDASRLVEYFDLLRTKHNITERPTNSEHP